VLHYECHISNITGAKWRLRRAFDIDENYRRIALYDADLNAL